jgi:hypothetical protein
VSAVSLDRGYRQFYNGRYESAVAVALPQCLSDMPDLAACELTTAALHFQIRRALGDEKDRDKALKACVVCPALMTTFMDATRRGQEVARARLEADAADDGALFLLGKVDLNYVWLQLGTLGRKTGWKEYWEARHSLDDLLERSPDHVRGRVARAWIDYIVDTRMPRGTKWLLGGGNRKRGLRVVADAAGEPAEFFVATEASFALWDMQVREKKIDEAVVTASKLARDFPENQELIKFLAEHPSATP